MCACAFCRSRFSARGSALDLANPSGKLVVEGLVDVHVLDHVPNLRRAHPLQEPERHLLLEARAAIQDGAHEGIRASLGAHVIILRRRSDQRTADADAGFQLADDRVDASAAAHAGCAVAAEHVEPLVLGELDGRGGVGREGSEHLRRERVVRIRREGIRGEDVVVVHLLKRESLRGVVRARSQASPQVLARSRLIGRRGGGREEHLTTLPGRRHLLELLHALRVEAQSRAALHRVHEAHHPRLELLGARQPGAQLANLILRVRLHLPQPHHLLQQQQPVALQLLHLAGDAAVRAQLQSVVAAAGHVRRGRAAASAGFGAGTLLWRRLTLRFFLLVSGRVVPAQRGEQLGFTLLEPLHAELEPVAVALAEAVVVELPDKRREIAVLERGGQLRGLEQVGLPHGERAALRGPGDDVVAAGVADEVPRFP
mmetsp:Transcript_1593/g.6577  ORF Transcript_1593/g.6577 Transcript_1593/m.6577 type:complete len:428 (+) Transcript_1593:266-1549(+)